MCEFCEKEWAYRERGYDRREVGDPRTGGMTTMTVTVGAYEGFKPVNAKFCPMCGAEVARVKFERLYQESTTHGLKTRGFEEPPRTHS